MIDRMVARRYAEAFVGALESAGRLDEGLEEIKLVAGVYAGSSQLQRFLESPEIGEEEKQRVLDRLFSDKAGPAGMGLLSVLFRKNRLDHLPMIYEESVAAAEILRGVLRGSITTARPISSAEVSSVAGATERLLNKKVILERRVDPKLLGGARVEVGTMLLDDSVQSLLEKARQYLLSVKVSE